MIVAADGEEALRLAAPNVDSLAMVITDVVMPRKGGRQLANELARLRPDLPVLFMSGYTEEPLAGETRQDIELIEKPVNPDVLLLKIREILERANQVSGPGLL